ncbi:MAG: sugar phosphate isomerase/epimerase [Clostridia bacterium]|nr:sugar phosphate isomerase/epimerase [Clostridia bacterium]
MLLSMTNGSYLKRGCSEEKMLDIVKDAGFTAMDFSFHVSAEYYDEALGSEKSGVEYYKNFKKLADERGIVFNQAHAPFASSFVNEEDTKKRFTQITTSMRNAAALGVKIIVVHPCQHLPYCEDGNPERLYEINMDFYSRIKPYCEEYGIKVALENMWQHTKGNAINHSTCSKPDEFIKYIDSLDKTWFTCCLDIGHTVLVREDTADFIRKLGPDRLGCLHVHDVEANRDAHTLPFYGIVDWNKVCKALNEIGYRGELT